MVGDLDRVWLVEALLALGDALKQHGYFDHAPELELLRHLRNGMRIRFALIIRRS
jgi:hypothetical protein